MKNKIIITGSSGYIGKELKNFMASQDYYIYALQRRVDEKDGPNIQYVSYNLEDEHLENEYFQNSDFLIHTAFQPLLTKEERDVNYIGTKMLLEKCREFDVQFIFLSTVSARTEISSRYSKSKLKIESLLDPKKDIILKLGLVIGNGGLFLRIYKIIKKSPLIPIFDAGKQKIQYICLNDVTRICLNLTKKFNPGKYVLVYKHSISMKDLCRKIVKLQNGKLNYLNISSKLVYNILKIAEYVKLPLPVSSENLLGLKNDDGLPQRLPKSIDTNEIKPIDDCFKFIKTKNSYV